MARKKVITKESIISTGLQMIRREGYENLNARHLAEEMCITTTPIFTDFGSMGNLIMEIWYRAKKEYNEYLLKSLDYPIAFKEFGLRFLNLAMEDSNVYKFVFSPPFSNDEIKEIQKADFDEVIRPILNSIRNPFHLSKDGVLELMHVLVTFTSGLAINHVVGNDKPNKLAYSIMLSHLFDAVCEYISKHEDIVSQEAFQKILTEEAVKKV